MQIKYVSSPPANPPGPFRKLAAVVVAVVVFSVALMFSAVLLAVIAVVGAAVWAWLWWKTRELRKQMREFSAQAQETERQPTDDGVFEGEVIRVVDPKDEK